MFSNLNAIIVFVYLFVVFKCDNAHIYVLIHMITVGYLFVEIILFLHFFLLLSIVLNSCTT